MVFAELAEGNDELEALKEGLKSVRQKSVGLLSNHGVVETRPGFLRRIWRGDRKTSWVIDVGGVVDDNRLGWVNMRSSVVADGGISMDRIMGDIRIGVGVGLGRREYVIGQGDDLVNGSWSSQNGKIREGVDLPSELEEVLNFVDEVLGR